MSASARSLRAGASCLAVAAVLASCAYDFDRFAADPGAPGGGGSGGDAAHAGDGSSAEAGAGGGSGGSGATSGATGNAGEGGSRSAGAGGESEPGAGNGGGGDGGAAGGGGADAGARCGELGGTLWNGACYFAIARGTGVQWGAAQSACAAYSESSRLVSIGSLEEQELLEAAFLPAVSDYWIGLSLGDTTTHPPPLSCSLDPASCPFAWVGGEPLTFTKWAVRSATDVEPNYTGACVRLQLDGFAWADFGCAAAQLPALCEWPRFDDR